jgi:uncharacterized protein (TIGR03435 family)
MFRPTIFKPNLTGGTSLVVAGLLLLVAPSASSQASAPTVAQFEVASIKQSAPDRDEIRIDIEGRHFNTQNTTLNYLIQFAYGLHVGQVIGGPEGREAERYDIAAEAEGEAQIPWKPMLQELLTDRFKLRFHREQREKSTLTVVIAKSGLKLTKNASDPAGHPDFSHSNGEGKIVATNATIAEFAGMLQDYVFRDQLVVDQTHLTGRFDFALEFTPDQSEYRGRFADRPLRNDSPPGFFTAIQEQLGLKMESAKVPIDVLVIDHFERPSEN